VGEQTFGKWNLFSYVFRNIEDSEDFSWIYGKLVCASLCLIMAEILPRIIKKEAKLISIKINDLTVTLDGMMYNKGNYEKIQKKIRYLPHEYEKLKQEDDYHTKSRRRTVAAAMVKSKNS